MQVGLLCSLVTTQRHNILFRANSSPETRKFTIYYGVLYLPSRISRYGISHKVFNLASRVTKSRLKFSISPNVFHVRFIFLNFTLHF